MIDVVRHERVVHLVINVPPVNVLDGAALRGLVKRLEELESDESVAASRESMEADSYTCPGGSATVMIR